ncbi:MAG: NAD kinase [Bacteroidales bacterium]|nr:NAD kinase [Bacteroidales bacterium]
MKIVLFGNSHQADKSQQVIRLFELLKRQNAEVSVDKPFYEFLKQQHEAVIDSVRVFEGDDFEANLAISVGGDGTFLNVAERIGRKLIPILGFNTGRLGFLADISENEMEGAVSEIFDGNYTVEERSQLRMDFGGDLQGDSPFALNEIAVMKQDSSSMITIHAWLNDQYLNTYQADGLIVATPTGSTAYSMSVGGPIVAPQSNNFIISPIAPHSLTVRPLVIPDDYTITLQVESRNNQFQVALDGRSHVVGICNIEIKKADFPIRVAKRISHTYYDTLRNKLMWGVDKRSFPQ